MRYLVSLFWGFIFAFIAIFIIKSILGDNGNSLNLQNIALLSVIFSIGCVGLDAAVGKPNKN